MDEFESLKRTADPPVRRNPQDAPSSDEEADSGTETTYLKDGKGKSRRQVHHDEIPGSGDLDMLSSFKYSSHLSGSFQTVGFFFFLFSSFFPLLVALGKGLVLGRVGRDKEGGLMMCFVGLGVRGSKVFCRMRYPMKPHAGGKNRPEIPATTLGMSQQLARALPKIAAMPRAARTIS